MQMEILTMSIEEQTQNASKKLEFGIQSTKSSRVVNIAPPETKGQSICASPLAHSALQLVKQPSLAAPESQQQA